MNETEIQSFWQAHPAGEDLVRSAAKFERDHLEFFENYDKFRYSKEAHILECLRGPEVTGQRLLEIGLGKGAGAEQRCRLGADWFGVDLTLKSCRHCRSGLCRLGNNSADTCGFI